MNYLSYECRQKIEETKKPILKLRYTLELYDQFLIMLQEYCRLFAYCERQYVDQVSKGIIDFRDLFLTDFYELCIVPDQSIFQEMILQLFHQVQNPIIVSKGVDQPPLTSRTQDCDVLLDRIIRIYTRIGIMPFKIMQMLFSLPSIDSLLQKEEDEQDATGFLSFSLTTFTRESNTSLIKDLSSFEPILLPLVIQESMKRLQTKADQMISKDFINSFLKFFHRFIQEIILLCKYYGFSNHFFQTYIQEIQKNCFQSNGILLLKHKNDGFLSTLLHFHWKKVMIMYQLFQDIPSAQAIMADMIYTAVKQTCEKLEFFKKKQRGMSIDSIEFQSCLLGYCRQWEENITKYFDKNETFLLAYRQSIIDLCIQNQLEIPSIVQIKV